MRWVLLALLPTVGAWAASPVDRLPGFPRFYCFRGEMMRPANSDYAAWSIFLEPGNGVIRKFLREELPVPEVRAEWATRWAGEHPDRLLLLHFNGEARAAHEQPEVRARFFPGHWVTTTASRVTAPAGAEATVLTVEDARPFTTRGYRERDAEGWRAQDVLLVDLDDQGRRVWSSAEYAQVRAVDIGAGTVTLARAQYGSQARARAAGRAALAPLVGAIWGGQVQWHYNLAATCPRDDQGRGAGDVLAAELAEAFAPGGRLAAFHGIAFDVNYWQARSPEWDTDADGRADGGVVGGRNVWREGDVAFLARVRAAVGEERLLTSDCEHANNQMAVGLLDGIESEGLVQPNDGWRGLSSTINIHGYWAAHATRGRDWRYIVLKLMDADDQTRALPLRRLGTAVACCLGAGVTRTESGEHRAAPELTRGDDQQPNWLGQPVGAMRRLAEAGEDLLAGRALELTGQDCTVARGTTGWTVSGAAADPLAPCRLTLPGIVSRTGDLTVFVELTMLDPLSGFDAASPVPRVVKASLSPLPVYERAPRGQARHVERIGLAGTRGASRLGFTWRDLPGGPVELRLEVAEQGRFLIRAISAYAASDLLARRFEHGVALANPSNRPATFDLVDLFGPGTDYRRLQCGWLPGYDGAAVTDPRRVVVPPLDGLLLRSEP